MGFKDGQQKRDFKRQKYGGGGGGRGGSDGGRGDDDVRDAWDAASLGAGLLVRGRSARHADGVVLSYPMPDGYDAACLLYTSPSPRDS